MLVPEVQSGPPHICTITSQSQVPLFYSYIYLEAGGRPIYSQTHTLSLTTVISSAVSSDQISG